MCACCRLLPRFYSHSLREQTATDFCLPRAPDYSEDNTRVPKVLLWRLVAHQTRTAESQDDLFRFRDKTNILLSPFQND